MSRLWGVILFLCERKRLCRCINAAPSSCREMAPLCSHVRPRFVFVQASRLYSKRPRFAHTRAVSCLLGIAAWQVFTTLALLSITQFTVGKFLYLAVQTSSESWVSIKRIENILLMEVRGGSTTSLTPSPSKVNLLTINSFEGPPSAGSWPSLPPQGRSRWTG